MVVTEVMLYSSACLGSLSGAASGYRASWLLACAGTIFGFLLGAGTFFSLYLAWAWCAIRQDKVEMGVSRFGKYLYFPVMIAALVCSTLVPWFVVGLLL
jgi:hypothetical protein